MSQSSLIALCLLLAFLYFLVVRGDLARWLDVVGV